MPDAGDRALAQIAIDAGLLTRDEASRYWQRLQAPGSPRLVNLLIGEGRLSQAQVQHLRRLYLQRSGSGVGVQRPPEPQQNPAATTLPSGDLESESQFVSVEEAWKEALEIDAQAARLFFSKGLVSQAALRECRQLQVEHQMRLSEVLVRRGLVDERTADGVVRQAQEALEQEQSRQRNPSARQPPQTQPGPTAAAPTHAPRRRAPEPAPAAPQLYDRGAQTAAFSRPNGSANVAMGVPPGGVGLDRPSPVSGLDSEAPTLMDGDVPPIPIDGGLPPGMPGMEPARPLLGPEQDGIPTVRGVKAVGNTNMSVDELNPFANLEGASFPPKTRDSDLHISMDPMPGQRSPGSGDAGPLGAASFQLPEVSVDELNAFGDGASDSRLATLEQPSPPGGAADDAGWGPGPGFALESETGPLPGEEALGESDTAPPAPLPQDMLRELGDPADGAEHPPATALPSGGPPPKKKKSNLVKDGSEPKKGGTLILVMVALFVLSAVGGGAFAVWHFYLGGKAALSGG